MGRPCVPKHPLDCLNVCLDADGETGRRVTEVVRCDGWDNLSTHSTPDIAKWLVHKDRRRWHLHYTPPSSSWLNLIEQWFKELTDKRLRRGIFTSVTELSEAITLWITHWNTDPKPFIWKAPAKDIITKVRRGRATLHQINTPRTISAHFPAHPGENPQVSGTTSSVRRKCGPIQVSRWSRRTAALT
jgi:hypothetical protein